MIPLTLWLALAQPMPYATPEPLPPGVVQLSPPSPLPHPEVCRQWALWQQYRDRIELRVESRAAPECWLDICDEALAYWLAWHLYWMSPLSSADVLIPVIGAERYWSHWSPPLWPAEPAPPRRVIPAGR